MRSIKVLLPVLLITSLLCTNFAPSNYTITIANSKRELNNKPSTSVHNDLASFKSRLSTLLKDHLDTLIDQNGNVVDLDGKDAGGKTAFVFYLMYERTGKEQYRKAALQLADAILQDMKATPCGVLAIKEEDEVEGGGPPSFAFITASIGYIYFREKGRTEDLKYIATILDNYPWNADGWWSASINTDICESRNPLTKQTPINKNASMAMACGMISKYVKKIDINLSNSLKQKVDKAIYSSIIPVQETDGFWHYNLNGNDPKDKDLLGYFMLSSNTLTTLEIFVPTFKQNKTFTSTLKRSYDFGLQCIAPIAAPNNGQSCANRTSPGTPTHFDAEEPKRGFQLGMVLFAGGNMQEGSKIVDEASRFFPVGNRGQDGVQSAYPAALILKILDQ